MSALADMRLTLTIEQTARLLGIGRSSAYEAARRGELPTLKLGRRLLVPTAKLADLLGDPFDNVAPAGGAEATETTVDAVEEVPDADGQLPA